MNQLQIGSVRAVFDNVVLPFGLVLDQVELLGENGTLETSPIRLAMPEPARAQVLVSAISLEEYLNVKAPGGLRDFKVALREGTIEVQATARVIVELRATATCTLRIEEETKLFVDLVKVDVLGGSAKNLVQGQLDKINPILDVNELPVSIRLKDVAITETGIVVTGLIVP